MSRIRLITTPLLVLYAAIASSAGAGEVAGGPAAGGEPGTYGALQFAGTVEVGLLPPASEDNGQGGARGVRLLGRKQQATEAAPAATESGTSPGPQPLSPPGIVSSFAGLSSGDNDFAIVPPDPQLAAGPDRIIEMVNIKGRVFDKSGGVLSTFNLATLFGVPSGYINFDPKVIYDAASGRFFAAYVSLCDDSFGCGSDQGRLHFAVSTTNNPLGTWNTYFTAIANDFQDYPGIGVTDDKVTISYNRFDIDSPPGPDLSPGCFAISGYCGVQTLVIQKSDLLAGIAATTFLTAADTSHFTVRPAHSLTPVTTQYMASVTVDFATAVHLWQVTGTPSGGNVIVSDIAHPAISSLQTPPDAQQGGTSELVTTNDNRILDAVWRNNRMWLSANGACVPVGDSTTRSCLKLIEVNTQTNVIVQDFLFGSPGLYYYFPAIRTDANANLHVVYSRSGAGEFVQTRVAGRLNTDPANTMSGDTLLKAGEIAYVENPLLDSSPYRWGDYMGAAVDPTDSSLVWVVGEYAKSDAFERWGTWIGKLQVDTDGDGIVDSLDNCPGVPNPSQGNMDGDSLGDVCDPDTDGDGVLNTSDPDDDNDKVYDVDETPCGGDSLNPNRRPERIDGVFGGVDDDGDGAIDEALPGGAAGFDCDGDGWKGSSEQSIYSAVSTANDQDPCGNNGWPAELSGGDNILNIGDFNSFIFPLRVDGSFNKFGHPVPDAADAYVGRWNLDMGGAGATVINIGDMNALNPAVLATTARPPMFGGQPAFFTNGGQCPWPP